MRFLVYGMLMVLALLLLADTNVGRPITSSQRRAVYQGITDLKSKGFVKDADLAMKIANSNHFRSSRFFASIAALGEARGVSLGYYAYTPLLSRTRVFLGSTFWDAGEIGHSSIILHELAHVEWHRERLLRGIPRHADEAQAYIRQYQTYRAVGLTPYGKDSMVFWDMMIGIKYYVVRRHPDYAGHADVRWALSQLDDDEKPFAGIGIALLYLAVATILLVGGDRLGSRAACAVLRRCTLPPLLHLREWIMVPIALLLPMIVILGFLAVVLGASRHNPTEVLADNLELILLAAFFLTGIIGGFLVQARRA